MGRICSHSPRSGFSHDAAQQEGANGRSHTCSQRISARLRQPFGIKRPLAEHRCGVQWAVWSPKGGRKGQPLAMVRGWGRWYPVESVLIERQSAGPSPLASRDWLALQKGRDERYTRGTDLSRLEEKHGIRTRKTGGSRESASPEHGDGRDAHHVGLATHP